MPVISHILVEDGEVVWDSLLLIGLQQSDQYRMAQSKILAVSLELCDQAMEQKPQWAHSIQEQIDNQLPPDTACGIEQFRTRRLPEKIQGEEEPEV